MKKQIKILVANRGEIAVRIIRTIHQMGHQAVAIHSSIDHNALHTLMADEVFEVGGPLSSESYLNIDRIITVAKKSGVHAVHPGYGFLSENASFAKALIDNGIAFIGPSPDCIESMGDKVRARSLAKKANAPMVEGTNVIESLQQAKELAKKITYPILLKAKAGGGGKGMRLIHNESELISLYDQVQSEAKNAFKDGSLYIEKYLQNPRHIEVQVFGFQNGTIHTLMDRECSIQRRHQKIIEEAPACISNKTKEAMAQASIRLAKEVGYIGAGTMEFLVDQHENFFFLEMNTRLQVEHPVTEWIYGIDLVKLQIQTALDPKFYVDLSDLNPKGHAIELRIYAEDVFNQFAPSPGSVQRLTFPSGPFVRVDSALRSNEVIPIYYDPMIAKISFWGQNRLEAVQRAQQALNELTIEGVKHNKVFLQNILCHPKYISNEISTHFIDEHSELFLHTQPTLEQIMCAIAHIELKLKKIELTPSTSNWNNHENI